MSVKIKRLYELVDDLQAVLIGKSKSDVDYVEIYPTKVVVDGFEYNAYVLRAKTFYEIKLSHHSNNSNFVLNTNLAKAGVICNYNKQNKYLYLYNCTENRIYIEENASIGDVYDG